MVAEDGSLGASFFCSRDYLDRKELKNIFPTLAYQLSCRYPAFRSRIIQVIKRDLSVVRNSLISQLKHLIIDPLSFTGISCVIVVDALDECVDDQPESAILSVLGRFVKQLPSVKFFITGRIRTGFRLPLLEPFTQTFLLHEVELSSIEEDIRLYLQEKLSTVAKRRNDFDLSDPWPSDEDLTALTKKSSGLFIFASTLARFIESEHHEPDERLQLIITPSDSTIHEGRAGIDPLYIHVLTHAFSGIKEIKEFANLRRVLGAVILAFNPLSRAQVAKILGVKTSLITTTLRHLHSVLLIPNEGSKETRVFHKSFPDFMQDPERCSDTKFFIASPVHHGDMVLGCLELLKGLKPNPCDLPDFVMNRDVADLPKLLEDKVGGALRYACVYWAMHVQSSPTTPTPDNFCNWILQKQRFPVDRGYEPREPTGRCDSQHSQPFRLARYGTWIHLRSIRQPFLILYPQKQADVSTSNLRSLVEDRLRFTMHFFYLIQRSAPHTCHSALPLSPSLPMPHSSLLREKTLIARFYGRPGDWGPVIRTIKGSVGRFTCMTTIGHGIAAGRDDGTVGIYDSITGVLRLSLSPEHPAEAVTGSPDGSMLFCTHFRGPSITLWDTQTGGLIHTFALRSRVTDTAVSLEGHYLTCGLSDGSVHFWEIANRMEGPAFGGGSPIIRLCWLTPEEQLVVADLLLVRIWNVVTGMVLYTITMLDPVCGTAYSQKLNQLAVVSSSGAESIITIIDPRTGASLASCRVRRRLSCLAFSQTTKELVCGMQTHGLQLFDVLTKRWRQFDHPATITSVFTLSNGTVVANSTGSGIHLLSPDEGCIPHRHPTTPTLAVYPTNEGEIITTIPITRDHVILLELASMRQLIRIPVRGDRMSLSNHTVVPCVSLANHMAVYCFSEGGKKNLQLWKFGDELRSGLWKRTNCHQSRGSHQPAPGS